jgi:hypothetical protein
LGYSKQDCLRPVLRTAQRGYTLLTVQKIDQILCALRAHTKYEIFVKEKISINK